MPWCTCDRLRERTECGELLGEAEVDIERDDEQRRAGERGDAHQEVQLQQRRHHLPPTTRVRESSDQMPAELAVG